MLDGLEFLEELIIYNEYDTFSTYSNIIYKIDDTKFKQLLNLKILILRNLSIRDLQLATVFSFQKLEVVDISFNSISGSINFNLCQLKYLKRINISNNQITGQITQISQCTGPLEIIEVQFNKLTGTIPVITGILSTLRVFDFTGNSITGDIPVSLNYFN